MLEIERMQKNAKYQLKAKNAINLKQCKERKKSKIAKIVK